MKLLLLIPFTLLFHVTYSQVDIIISHETSENGFNIYANNNEFCDVSLKLKITGKNINILEKDNKTYIIPPKTKKTLLATISKIKKNKATNLSYTYTTNIGIHNNKKNRFKI